MILSHTIRTHFEKWCDMPTNTVTLSNTLHKTMSKDSVNDLLLLCYDKWLCRVSDCNLSALASRKKLTAKEYISYKCIMYNV